MADFSVNLIIKVRIIKFPRWKPPLKTVNPHIDEINPIKNAPKRPNRYFLDSVFIIAVFQEVSIFLLLSYSQVLLLPEYQYFLDLFLSEQHLRKNLL